jgi:hypothetical protein
MQHCDTQQAIFGQGFGGISDLKVGQADGCFYVVSYGNGATYKILPKISSTTSSDKAEDIEKNPFADSKDTTNPTHKRLQK